MIGNFCQVQYETQPTRESLAADGYAETSPEGTADLYIINTCTGTSLSDEKSPRPLRLGCYYRVYLAAGMLH